MYISGIGLCYVTSCTECMWGGGQSFFLTNQRGCSVSICSLAAGFELSDVLITVVKD